MMCRQQMRRSSGLLVFLNDVNTRRGGFIWSIFKKTNESYSTQWVRSTYDSYFVAVPEDEQTAD